MQRLTVDFRLSLSLSQSLTTDHGDSYVGSRIYRTHGADPADMRVLRFSLFFTILLFVAALLWRPLETRIMTISSPTNRPTALARQLVLVTTTDWSAVTGTLQRFERAEFNQPW